MGQPPSYRPLPTPATRPLHTRLAARAVAVLTGLATAAAGLALTAGPAVAGNPVTPGDFTGYGFDQCTAPTSAAMAAWWRSSPYSAVGIYISGDSRGCTSQPNLSAGWVSQQQALGWKLLPITLGPQASCTTRERYLHQVRINPSSSSSYAAARSQGSAEASKAVSAARNLGIVAGSTLWYDLEAFNTSSTACRDSAMAFLSGWTVQLRNLGYVAGAYSSAASGIRAMAAATSDGRFTMPDQIWIADWNGVASTHTDYVSDGYWNNHRRVHQYRGGHDATYGGVTINIDSNWLDLGRGSVAPAATPRCGGVNISFAEYKPLRPGTTDQGRTRALQCLLSEKSDFTGYTGTPSGVYDAATMAGVRAFKRAKGQTVNNDWNRGNWMRMLTLGQYTIVKRGSVGEGVRQLQRALNASGASRLLVSGVASASTMDAVARYRQQVGLPAGSIADAAVWDALKSARK